MRGSRFPGQLALVLAGMIIGGVAATCAHPAQPTSGGVASAAPGPATPAALPLPAGAVPQLSFAEVAERVVDGVVNVSATRVVHERMVPFFDDPFGPFGPADRELKSLGSGVIVAADGTILTNNHVVEQAEDIRVTLKDGRELAAKVVGTDPRTDLAVLRIDGKPGGLAPLPIGDSSRLRLGDVVLAVGNPFGVGQTVTMGIVSATGRSHMGLAAYEDFIQTDAAINPGNSGGALVNLRGELIGINTAILSRSGGYQGVGFAIPTQIARPVMDSLVKNGTVVRGWLGVDMQDVDDKLAAGLGLSVKRGVLVSGVATGSPAERAGLRRGDVVVELDGAAMTSSNALRTRIAMLGPGASARLGVIRDGKRLEVRAVLGKLAGDHERPAPVAGGTRGAGMLDGVTVAAIDPAMRKRFHIGDQVSDGVVVTAVAPDSVAAGMGVEVGDVILEVNRQPVKSAARLVELGKAAGNQLVILLYRRGATVYLALRR